MIYSHSFKARRLKLWIELFFNFFYEMLILIFWKVEPLCSVQCSLQTRKLSTEAHHTLLCKIQHQPLPATVRENSLEREKNSFLISSGRSSAGKQIALEIKGNFCLWWWWLLLCQTLAKATPFLVKSWLLWHKFYLFFTGRICVIKLF